MRLGSLEITLYGPFVTLLNCNPIEIYAPRCEGHFSGIFTTEDEAELKRDYKQGMKKIYRISKSGIRPCKARMTLVNPNRLLKVPETHKLSQDARRSWFGIHLPKPRHVVGIKPDPMEVVGTDAPPGDTFSTALRLIFDYDMEQPEFVLNDGNKDIFKTKLKDYSAANPTDATRFEVMIRQVGPPVDKHHKDALSCFAASAKLFQKNNKNLDWKLKYPNPRMDGHTGGDCGSAHLIAA